MELKKYLPVLFVFLLLSSAVLAEEPEMEFTLDAGSSTIPLPAVFFPSADLGGRGFNSDMTWPQSIAAAEAIERWEKEVFFKKVYRLQYNLWEIGELSRNRQLQEKLLANYESAIKRISDARAIAIVDIFSTPQGQGKVLDKKSSPVDLKAFKALVKGYIRYLSCVKRYNVWYEVWTAPDLDIFFLGRQQEYLGIYRAVAESVKELEAEYKIHIPLGGPSSSWWFRNSEGNTAVTPERSLIYELIKFCYHYRLPLDFISWHAYSTDPRAEKELTVYNKTSVALIRDWLSYFNFPKDLPLIVDEWNYDSGENISAERKDRSYVAASFIPARLRHMYEADIDYQVFLSLEDFQNNKEGVARNIGAFWFEASDPGYIGGPKVIYNVFRMLSLLQPSMYISPSKINDEFVGMLATRSDESLAILIYNYIDPDILRSLLTRNIATLGERERKDLLDIVRSDVLEKLKRKGLDLSALKTSGKTRGLLKKALEAHDAAERFTASPRQFKLSIKNLKKDYLYTRYAIDSSCALNCAFAPIEEKSVAFSDELYSEKLALKPYSVHLIVLKPKPIEAETGSLPVPGEQPAGTMQNVRNITSLEPGETANVTVSK